MAILTNIYQKDSYTTQNISYLINSYIREYDISKANINILLYKNIINIEQYNFLYNAPRMERQIYIGKLARDNKEVNKALKDGFIEVRKMFFDANDLEEKDILSIKKDAIFIINKVPKITKFDNIELINKNLYTTYFKIDNLELYYFLDTVNDKELIDVKGINDDKLILHMDHFLDFICAVLCEVQIGNIEVALSMVQSFYNNYINLKLDKEYYRTFNSDSLFYVKSYGYNIFKMMTIDPKDLNSLNISVNRRCIEVLYGYISNMILNKKKR